MSGNLCLQTENGASGGFLLEGCADGIRTGGCVAGADVDLFCRAGAGAVMVCAVGYVAGNAVVFFAGFAGSFGRIVVHGSLSFQSKNLKDEFVFSYVIVCPIPLFYANGSSFSSHSAIGGIYHSRKARISLG